MVQREFVGTKTGEISFFSVHRQSLTVTKKAVVSDSYGEDFDSS